MNHLLRHIAAALIILSVTACDPDESQVENAAECPAMPLHIAPPAGSPDIAFREQPYAAYIDKIKGHAIDTNDFCETLHACDDIEPKTWRLTETGYKVNPGSSDDRSMGIGGSSLAGAKYWACITAYFDANGAVSF